MDSRDSYRGSFRPSIEGRDSCTTFGAQVQIDKVYMKLNNMDRVNSQIRQQLQNLSKISKDIKNDLETYKKEYQQNKANAANGLKVQLLSLKQRKQRYQKAEKREERHRAMRQGIHDMIHEQVSAIKQIELNIKT